MLRDLYPRATGLKIFRPEVETALKMTAAIVMLAALVLSLAWGHRQRNEARTWREIACAYRLKEALSDGRLLTAADLHADPCTRLEDLGLRVTRRSE